MRTMGWAVLVGLAASSAAADPSGDFCDKVWPKREHVTTHDTEACATYWMQNHARVQLVNNISAGEAYTDDALWRDFTSADFQRMLDHVTEAAAQEPDSAEHEMETSDIDQAREYFQVLVDAHFSVKDPRNGASFEVVLDEMLHGRRITREELAFWSPMVLWRLRNAPYARHGREFKMVDLHTFFYAGSLGLAVDPKFKESMLDAADRANTALVVDAIDGKLNLPDKNSYLFCQGECHGQLSPGDCMDLCALTPENLNAPKAPEHDARCLDHAPKPEDAAVCAAYVANRSETDAGWRLNASQLGQLADEIAARDATRADALRDLATSHTDLTDRSTRASIEPTLDKLLHGVKIDAGELARVTSVTLWRFRNAPYARHGRAFKMDDLTAFFYGGSLGLQQNPHYSDAQLDAIDRANVAAVLAEIHRRGEP
ncbi:MAG TPA: YARHG domain-containing protein [Kofleriaceae bacterium]